ncbi:protein FAM161A-like [Tubulanus polymorphus]|uniref:protein FAM161A-like n=1 Tax=Tubulanus polymorphus TaxID=672921 RepID=UPI003DA38626
MATVHYTASLTNSCVKPPVNPRTGLAYTLQERRFDSDHEGDEAENDVNREIDDRENRCPNRQQQVPVHKQQVPVNTVNNNTVKNIETSAMTSTDLLDKLTFELGDLTDDEFFDKLQQLKSEHKKTLSLYEKLYSDKKVDADEVDPAFHIDILRQSVEKPSSSDRVRDYSSKTCWMAPQSSADRHDDELLNLRRRQDALLNDYWKTKTVRNEEKLVEEIFRGERPEISSAAAQSRIDDMWENFSLDDYAPVGRRSPGNKPPSGGSRRTKQTESGWRHRITIPKPFEMTQRDENKPKIKTSAMVDLDRRVEDRVKEEEIECQKKFKARPVPAHVYIPLFDEVMEKAESQRRLNREINKELLKSKEKPFKFLKREEDKRQHRHDRVHSAPCHYSPAPIKPSFKARPIPRAVNEESVMDRIREEEEYRKIRIAMRSEELLRSAALPPSMEARQKARDMYKNMLKNSNNSSKKKLNRNNSRSRVRDPPNFDELHKKFHKEMINKVKVKESTVCKPFLLRTSSIPSNIDKIQDDIRTDERELTETRWPFKSKRATHRGSTGSLNLSQSLDNIPAKLTTSAELRSSANRGKIHQMSLKEQELREKKRLLREKEKRLKREIAEKAAANDQSTSLKQTEKEKLKRFKEAERERSIEYQQELRQMKEKLKNRPFLFEQQSQVNARKQAEKRYSDTIRDAGLDEQFIYSKGTATTDYNDDDDDDDISDDEEVDEVGEYEL